MPFYLSSFIAPTTTAVPFIVEDLNVRGGFRQIADIAARDLIHMASRKKGMQVYVQSDDTTYTLATADVSNAGWSVLDLTDKVSLGAGLEDDGEGNIRIVPGTYAAEVHSHAIADTTGLQAALDAKVETTALTSALALKSDTGHGHAIADTTGLQAALDAKTDASANTIDGLTDTTITTVADGEVLRYTGTEWINNTLAEAGIAAASHTHAIADTTGLQAALDGKAASAHSHAIADTTGLQAALDGKAASVHSHAVADVTGLQAALDAKADSASNSIDGLTDTTITTVADGEVLRHNGTAWVNNTLVEADIAKASEVTSALSGKSDTFHSHFMTASDDVTVASLANLEILQYNSTSGQWENKSLAGAGLAATVHTHAIADVTGLQAAIDGKAASVHTHAIADTTGLQSALDGKAASVHTHAIADTTGLQAALDAKADSASNSVTGLTDTTIATVADFDVLSYDNGTSKWVNRTMAAAGISETGHTHVISAVTGLQSALDGKAASVHSHAIADVTGLQTALDGKTATGHGHAIADTTGLQAALDGKAASAHVHAGEDITTGTVAAARLPQVSTMSGVTISAAAPTGGADGDIWFQVV